MVGKQKFGQVTEKYKLVLLFCLRDLRVQEATTIADLFLFYCKGDKRASEIVSASSDQLVGNGGKNLILLLDGFDELPENLQKNSLIANILKLQVLPKCCLILSSRPHVSKRFHNRATFIINILGFTEESRIHFIYQAFQEEAQKAKELLQYLNDHSEINRLCFVPLNISILVFLHQQGILLPKSSIDMYDKFIYQTIRRYLSKSGYPHIDDINDLPKPYNRIIEIIDKLSTLSLQALSKNKLIFTLDEVSVSEYRRYSRSY